VTNLETALLHNAPIFLRAAQRKAVTSKPIRTKVALCRYSFIEFNSPERISWLVYDIDIPPNDIRELEQYAGYIEHYLLLPKPTYICKTTKGFHVAYALSYGVLAEQTSANQRLAYVHAALSKLLGSDPNAARMRGIWRNPLKHEHIYNPNSYTLDELVAEHGELVNPKSTKNVLDTIRAFAQGVTANATKSLAEENTGKIKFYLARLLRALAQESGPVVPNGFRKSVLFQGAMLFAKNHGVSYGQLEEYLDTLNKYTQEPLPPSELDNIAKSVWKYKQANSIFVKNPLKDEAQRRMNLKESLPLHVKQRKGAGYTNKVRIEKTKTRLEIALKTLQNKKMTISMSSLAKEANLTRQTVAKHQDVIERTLLCTSKTHLRDFFLSLRFYKPVNYGLICFTLAQNLGGSQFPFESLPLWKREEKETQKLNTS